ncbi:hypothetical protein ASPZODRAFT_841597 [Penicilliopsis zonata CBS 506.65]|uniref:Secreted protein n=1 Tax=Penicilliopsis zonata CBS 506.65 TaxID=1073090 RepID=A0A1L9SAJ0_9EURO|nr:hypothetical protein ASPZODRAFT_841597 [Penicilliopsis zonata CBS 506.65]OJJ44156.1 hypothetical protein ASPZODRAFT_841597 [Penicilliopsis zonata CBS 506.65]
MSQHTFTLAFLRLSRLSLSWITTQARQSWRVCCCWAITAARGGIWTDWLVPAVLGGLRRLLHVQARVVWNGRRPEAYDILSFVTVRGLRSVPPGGSPTLVMSGEELRGS